MTRWAGTTSISTAEVYRVEYTRKALKQIAGLDRTVARRIGRFFGQTLDLSNPRSRGKAADVARRAADRQTAACGRPSADVAPVRQDGTHLNRSDTT